MKVLAVSTSTSQVGVAIAGADGVVAGLRLRQGRRHGETLAPAIDSLTRLSGVSLADLTLVAVDIGPGLFTGLRVGVSTAKALAAALDLPLAGCTSLDLLAQPHWRDGRLVASVVDAKRGEVFWALYEPFGAAMRQVTRPSVASPDVLAGEIAGFAVDRGPVLLVGEGARRYAHLFSGGEGDELAPVEFDHPSAEVLASLAPGLACGPAEAVVPMYLRGADVRIGWEVRDG